MQKLNTICVDCHEELHINDGFWTCLRCGLLSERAQSANIPAFDTWHEFSSQYTRVSRFRKLMKQVKGEASLKNEVVKYIWENREKFTSPNVARDILCKSEFSACQNKISSVMLITGHTVPNLSLREIERGCMLFRLLDRGIALHSGKKAAFTFLLPAILFLMDRGEIVRHGWVKMPSPLLWKKYGTELIQALDALNFVSEEGYSIVSKLSNQDS